MDAIKVKASTVLQDEQPAQPILPGPLGTKPGLLQNPPQKKPQ
jgi:hypothetical protein